MTVYYPVHVGILAYTVGIAHFFIQNQCPVPEELQPSSACPEGGIPLPVVSLRKSDSADIKKRVFRDCPRLSSGTIPGAASPDPWLFCLIAVRAHLDVVVEKLAAGDKKKGNQCVVKLQHSLFFQRNIKKTGSGKTLPLPAVFHHLNVIFNFFWEVQI